MTPLKDDYLARGAAVAIRHIEPADLDQISRFGFTVSITVSLTERTDLEQAFAATGFRQHDAGAVAIVELSAERLIGTCQFYRAAPCIHGYELGYIIHESADRGRGYASEAVRLFSDHLFAQASTLYRQQLLIEVWNTPSWKLAERCGFVREGLLRSAGFGDGDPADCFIYARTRKDWHEERHTRIGVSLS